MPYLTPDFNPSGYIRRVIEIPANIDFLSIVNGAISELIHSWNFQQFGALSADETALIFQEMFLKYLNSETTMGNAIGQVVDLVTAVVPDNMLLCDGVIYNRVDYPELYAVLTAQLIIDADTFFVPDYSTGAFTFGIGIPDYGGIPLGGEPQYIGLIRNHAHAFTDQTAVHNHALEWGGLTGIREGTGDIKDIPQHGSYTTGNFSDQTANQTDNTGDGNEGNLTINLPLPPGISATKAIVAR